MNMKHIIIISVLLIVTSVLTGLTAFARTGFMGAEDFVNSETDCV